MTTKEFLVICPVCGHTLHTRSEDKEVMTCFRCETEFSINAKIIKYGPGVELATGIIS